MAELWYGLTSSQVFHLGYLLRNGRSKADAAAAAQEWDASCEQAKDMLTSLPNVDAPVYYGEQPVSVPVATLRDLHEVLRNSVVRTGPEHVNTKKVALTQWLRSALGRDKDEAVVPLQKCGTCRHWQRWPAEVSKVRGTCTRYPGEQPSMTERQTCGEWTGRGTSSC